MARKTLQQMHAQMCSYAALGGFTVEGCEGGHVLARPTRGSLMRLTPREADIFLSGYLAHHRHTEQGATPA